VPRGKRPGMEQTRQTGFWLIKPGNRAFPADLQPLWVGLGGWETEQVAALRPGAWYSEEAAPAAEGSHLGIFRGHCCSWGDVFTQREGAMGSSMGWPLGGRSE
jgi:hypothetical protein